MIELAQTVQKENIQQVQIAQHAHHIRLHLAAMKAKNILKAQPQVITAVKTVKGVFKIKTTTQKQLAVLTQILAAMRENFFKLAH